MEDTKTKSPAALLLDKRHNIAAFCTEDESRHALMGAHYDAERQVLAATDGRILIEVSTAGGIPANQFPRCKTALTGGLKSCTIPQAALAAAFNQLPQRGTLEVLNRVLLTGNGVSQGEQGEIQKVALTTTNLDDDRTITTKCMDTSFPNTKNLWPTFEAKAEICLDPKYLDKVWQYAMAAGATAVKLELSGDPLSPARISILLPKNEVIARVTLMPMRSA